MKNRSPVVFLLTLLASLGTAPTGAMEVHILSSPAESQSSLSRLTTDPKGGVHLSWVQTREKESALYHSTLEDQQWSEPSRIASGNNWFVNWADFPFLSVNTLGKTAHWLQQSSDGTYDYDVVASFYNPISTEWRAGKVIHKDGISAEHGFVSMLPMEGSRTFITWLDGRNTKNGSDHGVGGTKTGTEDGPGGMTLRAGIFSQSGETEQEWELDGLTCDCCQTSSALASEGPVVVYRDRTVDEIRDIYITRWVKEAWTTPVPVYTDSWQIAGCPVNGPAVAAQEDHLAVAWFSANNDHPKVSLAISNDGGATFQAPVTIADGNTNGRVSIAILASGKIAVSWLQTNGPNADLEVSLLSPTGQILESGTVAQTKSSRRSGFPVLVAQGESIYITWTDITDSNVKVARVEF